MKKILFAGLLLLAPMVATPLGFAAQTNRTERVQFAKGASSTVIKGEVKGSSVIDYVLKASAGQVMSVTLESNNASNAFNVLPSGTEEAMFIGSISGNRFAGMLPTDGEFRIRVYLLGNSARQNLSSKFTLKIGITGKALVATPAAQDALIPGTPYHASGSIPCSQALYPAVKACEAFVIRRGFDGTATLEVRFPGGGKRHLLFIKGKPVTSDLPAKLTSKRQGDHSLINLETQETFDVPDPLILGD